MGRDMMRGMENTLDEECGECTPQRREKKNPPAVCRRVHFFLFFSFSFLFFPFCLCVVLVFFPCRFVYGARGREREEVVRWLRFHISFSGRVDD